MWEALAFARADAEGPLWGSVLQATSPRAAQQAEGRGGRSSQGQGAGVDALAFHFPPPELPRESLPAGPPPPHRYAHLQPPVGAAASPAVAPPLLRSLVKKKSVGSLA